ncbi:MAG TPA: ATP-binding protein [Rhizomicrobium sp.]|nr:ATP-binding protein [Rhizomicrobium sp.]
MNRRPAESRWLVALAAGIALLLLTLGFIMAHYEDALYSQQQQRNFQDMAQILAASVTAAIEFDDSRAAQEYVDALKVNPAILATAVFGQHGRIANFQRAGIAPLADNGASGTIEDSDNLIRTSVAVEQKGHVIGLVTLLAAGEPAGRRLARYLGLVLLAAMGALVIIVLSVSQVALVSRARQLSEVNARLIEEMQERARTEEALRQSQKMEAIGQLSGGIAHDFNNLIMIAKGNLMLLRRRLGPNEHLRFAAAADEALDRAAGLTHRILAFSRRQALTPRPVDISDLIEGMADMLRHSTGEAISIKTDLKATWRISCDVNQMENMILNLALNARDAMPEGGTLAIETRDVNLTQEYAGLEEVQPGSYVQLSVNDTGSGMSEEVRARAVDPFFTTKPQGKGTGLGLSTSFGFVRQSRGYLTIDSAPGKGTRITIYMPKLQEQVS